MLFEVCDTVVMLQEYVTIMLAILEDLVVLVLSSGGNRSAGTESGHGTVDSLPESRGVRWACP